MASWHQKSAVGPSRSDLEAIESEWPTIAAELAALDTEIAAAARGDELAVRRARRATARRASSFLELPDGAA